MPSDVPPLRRSLPAHLWSSSVFRYLSVGGLSFLFDYGLLWFLHEALGVGLAIATPVAFLASFVVTYTLQRVLAFRSASAVASSALKYATLVAVNTLATTFIVWGVAALGAPWGAGKVIAVVSTTVWNYFLYRHWVFRSRKDVDV